MKTGAKRYQFMENFRLLFDLLRPCYVAERVAKIFNTSRRNVVLPCMFKTAITNVKWKHLSKTF